jgi:hypothetical protein
MYKNQPKQESDQAILARVEKEMDEPRMAESTRRQPHYAAGFGKAAVPDVAKNSRAAHSIPVGGKSALNPQSAQAQDGLESARSGVQKSLLMDL